MCRDINFSLWRQVLVPVRDVCPLSCCALLQYRSTFPTDSADFRRLTNTLDALSTVLSLNNEAIREHDRRLEMMHRMMRIVKQTNVNVLDTPYRELLKEGSFLCKRYVCRVVVDSLHGDVRVR